MTPSRPLTTCTNLVSVSRSVVNAVSGARSVLYPGK